ncbi:hypothetical protein KIM67_18345 [Flagellimonas sp. 389]|uniref:hypothetical protein n=1 Tax=Flagellimonas sp. 389 TaxID=2835862 RepID=UPI001BD61053|nr:hypothetical protein [Flagellimonas sp. 389]MBS9464388.1 hypothetical protein [Flagellimonas sp. 389]
METGLLISILGAVSAIIVSLVGAWLANRNSISLQTRKLKEQHYTLYIEALHYLIADNNNENIGKYVFARDRLFLIANEDVIKKMIAFEENTNKKVDQRLHDTLLTDLVKSIRKDLRLKDKNFPHIYFKTNKKSSTS